MLLGSKPGVMIFQKGKTFALLSILLLPRIGGAKEIHEGWNTGVQVSSYAVVISDRMKLALDALAPTFKLWETEDFSKILKIYPFTKHQCPQAIFADFNGDGIGDAVLWGYVKQKGLLVAILSYKKDAGDIDYKAVTVREVSYGINKPPREIGPGLYLSIFPSQKIKAEFDQPPLDLKTPGIEVLNMGAPVSQMYYYRDGKFNVRTTGD